MSAAVVSRSEVRRRLVTSPGSEHELLTRARRGDQDAFRQIVDAYSARVFALVRTVVHQSAEAEDVTQEVFFKVYTKLDSFREDSSFYTWLYRVALNTANDHLKKRRQDRAVLVEDLANLPVSDAQDSPAEDLSRRDLQTEVRGALAKLPEKFRTILVLRELEGLAYEEISQLLGISIGTVESRIFRARERLRKLLVTKFRGP